MVWGIFLKFQWYKNDGLSACAVFHLSVPVSTKKERKHVSEIQTLLTSKVLMLRTYTAAITVRDLEEWRLLITDDKRESNDK